MIVPCPEAVVDDADLDVWGELRDPIAEAIGLKIDAAEPADSTPEQGGVYGDIEGAMALVEDDGFTPSAVAAASGIRRAIRQARSTQGTLLGEGSTSDIWDLPVSYVMPGVVAATVRAVVGDFSLAMIGIRQDITYKVLDQAVISDDTGKVIFNLAQQDMLALRVRMRTAFATGVPATRVAAANAYPFATLEDPAAPGRAARSTKS